MALHPPQHIGIIMDGNGRWANVRGKSRTFGHIKGARIAKKIITECVESGVKHLTLYAFSTENWLRPADEVNFLMRLLQRYLTRELKTLVKQNVVFKAIGDLEKLSPGVRGIVQKTIETTKNNSGMHLNFAISYGSRWEIVEATKSIAQKVKNNELALEQIDEQIFHSFLTTNKQPDPDLIIRTSGESRLSNFLLWQSAYSELFFTNTLWPDFTTEEFHSILVRFAQRTRRFGAIGNLNESLNY